MSLLLLLWLWVFLFCIIGSFFPVPALMSHCFNNLGLARETIFVPYNRSIEFLVSSVPAADELHPPTSLGQIGGIRPWVLQSPAEFSRPQIPATWGNSALALRLCVPLHLCFLPEMSSIRTDPARFHGWGVTLHSWSTPESIALFAASSHLKQNHCEPKFHPRVYQPEPHLIILIE